MNPIRIIRRLTAALAGLACAWLGLAVAAPAAFAALSAPPPGSGPPGFTVPHEPPGSNNHLPLPPGHVGGPVYEPPVSPPRILPARALAWIRAHLPPGWNKHPPLPPVHAHQLVHASVRTVIIGGMPGWQIALIAVGAALLAATVALLTYRAWSTRRKPVTAPA